MAIKCRNPGTRRVALDLLQRAPRKELLWAAREARHVAQLVIDYEEQALSYGDIGGYSIPDEARVRDVDVLDEVHDQVQKDVSY